MLMAQNGNAIILLEDSLQNLQSFDDKMKALTAIIAKFSADKKKIAKEFYL
jgi:hypothetical protein